METLLVFVTVLAAVLARNVPNTDYVPTKEQLAMIFGAHIPVKASAVETPAPVPNESVNMEQNIKPYQNNVTEALELNIKIKVNDLDKKGRDKTAKQNPEEGGPDIQTRFVADRENFGVKECASDKVRFNEICVIPEPEEHV